MVDQRLPDDIRNDHLAHMDNDINLYEAQSKTLQMLVETCKQQLAAAEERVKYVNKQLEAAKQAKADFLAEEQANDTSTNSD